MGSQLIFALDFCNSICDFGSGWECDTSVRCSLIIIFFDRGESVWLDHQHFECVVRPSAFLESVVLLGVSHSVPGEISEWGQSSKESWH